MGCSPARPNNHPIIVSSGSAPNHLSDNNLTKVDHRVLSEKFMPLKAKPQESQLETIEAPNILAFDPRNGLKKEFDISGIPHYDSTNVTLNGKWLYIENTDSVQKEVAFVREDQHKVEKDFVKGMLRSELNFNGGFAVVTFKDMIVAGNKTGDDGKKEHFVFPIKRTPLRREIYGWAAEDGVVRPIVREIEDILNFTTGVYTYCFDDQVVTIDLKKSAFIDTQTAFARQLIKF